MAKAITYNRSLPETQGAAFAYRYAVTIPASDVAFSGGAVRVQFRAPSLGGMSMSSVYIGHKGAGEGDFDGGQVQLTVGGSPSWTVAAGQMAWSDPVAFPLDETLPVVVRYNLSAGSKYANSSGVTGASLHFILGSDPNDGNSFGSGYSAISGWIAVVSQMEAGADLGDFDAPVDDPEEEEEVAVMHSQKWGIDAISGDEIFARGDFIPAQSGKHLHVNLNSQAGSGKAVYLWSIDITPDADTGFSIRSLLPDDPAATWENIPAICNANFKTPETYATARLKKGFADAVIGGLHSVGTLKGGVMKSIYLPHCPLVKVYPNFTGACLALHAAGVGAAVTFHWQELSD